MDGRVAVLVLVLVTLAGCSALTGDESRSTPSDEVVTPVPVTDAPSPTASPVVETRPVSGALPPGVFANGTVDTGLLAWVHDHASSRQSYTWSYQSTRHSGDPVVDESVTTLTVFRDEDDFLVDQPAPDGSRDRALYVANETGYLASLSGNETTVLVTDDPGEVGRYDYSRRLIIRYMTGPRFSVQAVERDGVRFYRLHAGAGPVPNVVEERGGPVSNFSATAYVTPGGFVRTFVVEYDRRGAGSREHVSIRFDYANVGETTMSEPDWVAGAELTESAGSGETNGTATPVGGTDTATDPTPSAP